MAHDLSEAWQLSDDEVRAHIENAHQMRAEMIRDFFKGLFAGDRADARSVPGSTAAA